MSSMQAFLNKLNAEKASRESKKARNPRSQRKGNAAVPEPPKKLDKSEAPVAPQLPALSSQELTVLVQRNVNKLLEESKFVRRAGLIDLHSLLNSDRVTRDMSADIFSILMKPCLRRFGDEAEKCREFSITIFTKLLLDVDDFGPSLPYLFPVLKERLAASFAYDADLNIFVANIEDHEARKRGRAVAPEDLYSSSVVEPSEEIRLLLCECLKAVMKRAQACGSLSMLFPYNFDLALLLQSCARDPFPDLKRLACELLVFLCQNLPAIGAAFAVSLVRVVMPDLAHRRAAVRIAALDAVERLVAVPLTAKCKGAGTEAIEDLIGHRDTNVLPVAAFFRADAGVTINRFAQLAQDKNIRVRARFVAVLGNWLHDLPDRMDHISRLLPFLLGMVADDDIAVSSEALRRLTQLGDQFEKENADSILEKRQYGVDGIVRNHEQWNDLPAPFTCMYWQRNSAISRVSAARPKIGARLYVRGQCRRFLAPMLKEMEDWIATTKARAARLLVVCIVLMEEHITVSLHHILRTLCRCFDTKELAVAVRQAGKLCGRFCLPSSYIPLLTPIMEGSNDYADPKASERAAGLLAVMLCESTKGSILPHLQGLAESVDRVASVDCSKPMMARLCQCCSALCASCAVGSVAITASFEATGRLTSSSKVWVRLLRVLLEKEGFQELARATMGSELPEEDALRGMVAEYGLPLFLANIQAIQDALRELPLSDEGVWRLQSEPWAIALGVFALSSPDMRGEHFAGPVLETVGLYRRAADAEGEDGRKHEMELHLKRLEKLI